MSEALAERVCAVRFSGASQAALADAGDQRLDVGQWVAVRTMAGEDPARVVVAPDQWLEPPRFENLFEITRSLADSELDGIAALAEGALQLIDPMADRLRSQAPDIFLAGIRFNLAGDRLTLTYIGPEPNEPDALAASLGELAGFPVALECPRSTRQSRGLHGGGPGRIAGRRYETFNEMLRDRLDVLNTPGTFAPQGLPRLGSRVRTARGEGRLVAVNIRHWQATVELDAGDEVRLSVDDLRDPEEAP
jgi:cell fate regulator YaaT (PSP1 superfamily)